MRDFLTASPDPTTIDAFAVTLDPTMYAAGERCLDARTRCWLGWYADAYGGTRGDPEAIRDKWNGLSNQQRRAIDPEAWQRIAAGISGREFVRRSLLNAQQRRHL